MALHIFIAVIVLSTSLIAQHEPLWSAREINHVDQESSGIGVFKEWSELSHSAMKADQREPRKIKVERSFNKNANETSSSVDCGVICDFPEIGLQIEVKIHYFFEGNVVPKDIDDNIAVTFNIKGSDSERRAYFIISSLEPDFITKKSDFRPETEGIGSLNEEDWSYSLLAIMSEVDGRRLLTEEVDNVNLGPFAMTRPDLIRQGLKVIFLDLDDRRKAAPIE